jgi:erythromycin esterase
VEAALSGGVRHRYAVHLPAGGYLDLRVEQLGVDAVVALRSPAGVVVDEVDGPSGAAGEERVVIGTAIRGRYVVEVREYQPGPRGGRYRIRIEKTLTPAANRRRLALERGERSAVAAWLRGRAIPLASLSAEDTAMFGDARVVALGEATHGSREFMEVRRQITMHLVRSRGFVRVALEGSVAEGERLDAYIQGAVGEDARSVLLNQAFWIPRTAEMARRLDDLRTYNQGVEGDRRVRIVGVDPQDVQGYAARIRAYLDDDGSIPTELAVAARGALDTLEAADREAARFGSSRLPASVRPSLVGLQEHLISRRHRIEAANPGTAEPLVRAVTALIQFASFNSGAASRDRTRDAIMAENTLAVLHSAPAGTGVVLLAHNAHVAAARDSLGPTTTGGVLRSLIGARYFAVGMSFGGGSFLAQDVGSTAGALRVFGVAPAAEGTLDGDLGQVCREPFFVSLVAAGAGPPEVRRWLARSTRMHWVGAMFSQAWGEWHAVREFAPGTSFDGLVYVPRSSPVEPLDTLADGVRTTRGR